MEFPALAERILFVPTGTGGVVYDLVTQRLTFVNKTAAAVLAACATGAPLAETISMWAQATGSSEFRIETDVTGLLIEFDSTGWIDNDEMPAVRPGPDPAASLVPPPLPKGEHAVTFRAGPQVIRIRSTDAHIVDELVDVIGLAPCNEEPSRDFHVMPQPDGSVLMATERIWEFADRHEMTDSIVTAVNEKVSRTRSAVVLHAAAMCDPSGAVLLFPALAGGGKSTLAADLARRGWTYLTDEAVTVELADLTVLAYPKALMLDDASRRVLGMAPVGTGGRRTPVRPDELPRLGGSIRVGTGRIAPPDAIVFVRHIGRWADGLTSGMDDPGPDEALVDLVRSTLNLRIVGLPALETLVELAERVPIHSIRYRSTDEALELLDTCVGNR